MRGPVLAVFCLVAFASAAAPPAAGAQQPFVSDDAGVSDPGVWHLELSNQVDRLRGSARPLVWQNLFETELDYGLPHRVELSAIVPILTLGGDVEPTRIGGVGDSAFGVKVRFTRDPAARHALAASMTIEVPTGDRSRELGSGLVDYSLNLISQHAITDAWWLVLNGGALLAGDSSTGALGIRERGTIVNVAGSLRRVRGRVHYGAELAGAWSLKASIRDSVLAAQVGANILLTPGSTLDIGGGTGWFLGASRATFQIGLSMDLNTPKPARADAPLRMAQHVPKP